MQKIAIICAFFLVVLLALVGCLTIFGVMSADTAFSMMWKFGAAIILLGVCSALVKAMMKS